MELSFDGRSFEGGGGSGGSLRQEGRKQQAGKVCNDPFPRIDPGNQSTLLDCSILPVGETEGKAKAIETGKKKCPIFDCNCRTQGATQPAVGDTVCSVRDAADERLFEREKHP